MAKQKKKKIVVSLPAGLADTVKKRIKRKERDAFFESAVRKELRKRILVESVQKAFGPFEKNEKPLDRITKIYALLEESGVRLPFSAKPPKKATTEGDTEIAQKESPTRKRKKKRTT